MKTIFRFLSMAALLAGIAVTGAFAQEPCSDVDTPTAQYEKFLGLYNKKPQVKAEVQEAVNTGKAFLEKFGACEAWKDQSAFVKQHVTRLETKVIPGIDLNEWFLKFDNAIKSDNADELYAAGKEILAKQPDNLNIMFVMAVVGPREVGKKNMKYNADSLRYAKAVYDKLKAGTELPKTGNDGKKYIGALKYEMGKDDAMSELAFVQGYMNFYGLNNKKAAMPFYYELSQSPGGRKTFAPAFATIGEFYLAERAPIGDQIAKKIAEIKAAPTDEEKVKLDGELKPLIALFNGYTERALDAFSRAWKLAKDDTPAGKTYKDGLYKEMQAIYEDRFEKKEGLDQWISAAIAKPLPDPTSTVQPVADPEVTTTTNTTTGGGGANGSGIGTANGTGVGTANGTGLGTPSGKTVGTPAAPKAAVAKKP